MTQDHGDAGDLVARLRNPKTMIPSHEAADFIEVMQAKIERLNHDAEVVECAIDGYERGNEFEGKSVDACIGIIGRRAEAAECVVEAMRCIVTGKVPFDKALKPGATMNWEDLLRVIQKHASKALIVYDKTTATLATRAAAESFLDDMGEETKP